MSKEFICRSCGTHYDTLKKAAECELECLLEIERREEKERLELKRLKKEEARKEIEDAVEELNKLIVAYREKGYGTLYLKNGVHDWLFRYL